MLYMLMTGEQKASAHGACTCGRLSFHFTTASICMLLVQAQRGTEDESDPGSQSPSDSEDQSPDPSPRPTDASAQPPDFEPQKQQQQQASIPPASAQTQEVISDRLQQVAAAAADVDPETAADIAADAPPLFPETARAAKSKASFNAAFSTSQSTALPDQGELLLGSGDADVFNDAAIAAANTEQATAYEEQEERALEQPMQVAFSRPDAGGLEPPIASDTAPTVSAGPKASKGEVHCVVCNMSHVIECVTNTSEAHNFKRHAERCNLSRLS